MIRKTCIASLLALLLLLSGCFSRHYKIRLLHDETAITKIEIGTVGELLYDHETESNYQHFTVKSTITDIEAFLAQLNDLPCTRVFSDPMSIIPGDAIKITYENGDYELIGYMGNAEFKDGRLLGWRGYHHFDEAAFYALLERYC